MNLKIKKLTQTAKLPTRGHEGDAGIDLYSDGEYLINSGETKAIPVGVALEIPFGYVGLIWDRSSLGSKGLKTLGGVIDSGYRGEVKVLIHNLSQEAYKVEHNHKLAQILIQKVELLEIEEVESLSAAVRGENGFGSTGE